MQSLLAPYVYDRLRADATLLSRADISIRRKPTFPEKLSKPVVVVEFPLTPDELGLHGGAQNLSQEIRIFGYGNEMDDDVAFVADRITLLMPPPINLSDGSVTSQLYSELGWIEITEGDPKIIHVLERFVARLWSATKIATLTS